MHPLTRPLMARGFTAKQAESSITTLFRFLATPPTETRQTLLSLGITPEGIPQDILRRGLLTVLSEIVEASAGDTDLLRRVFPQPTLHTVLILTRKDP